MEESAGPSPSYQENPAPKNPPSAAYPESALAAPKNGGGYSSAENAAPKSPPETPSLAPSAASNPSAGGGNGGQSGAGKGGEYGGGGAQGENGSV